MKCPNCELDNPEGTQFCGNCGSRLIEACRSCGALNSIQLVVCASCGQSLTALPVASARDPLSDKHPARSPLASSAGSGSDATADVGLTNFLGRDKELELLQQCFQRCKSGTGRAFFIVGEAGVGKTRLLHEFRKAVAHEDVTFLVGTCLPHGKGVSYHPVTDILRAVFGVRDRDPDSLVREKVRKVLEMLDLPEGTTLPYILELLSVKESGIKKIAGSPEAVRHGIIESMKALVLSGSQVRPLVAAIEDFHWRDKSTEQLSRYLLASIEDVRVMLI
ncbi:MAG: AAA family ATPase, partial [Deltaproteobacteria bacterium]|nr:AAA family ATPase [Deltaproteobacteria bacterium]